MFNYYQTDDRDDYFATLGNNKVRKPTPLYNLTLNGELIFESVEQYRIKQFAKKKYNLTGKQVKYGLFKQYLIDDGYIIDKLKQN